MTTGPARTPSGFTLIAVHDAALGAAVETSLAELGRLVLRVAPPEGAALENDVWGPDVESALDRLIDRNGPIGALVTDAPVGPEGPLLDTPTPTVERFLVSGFLPSVRLIREAGRRMIASGDGRIVVVVRASSGGAGGASAVSSAVSSGLTQLCRRLAREWATQRVWVNVVDAGHLDSDPQPEDPATRRIPLRRLGSASDVAAAVTHLITEASFMTGSVFSVDGGLSAKS